MKNYTTEELYSLIKRFEAHSLPKPEWTHEAHLVVAIWYTNLHDDEESLNKVRSLIIQHNESVGTPNTDDEGYHETITQLWMKIARIYLKLQPFDHISTACNEFINSNYSSSIYPLTFYSEEVLFSVEARRHWVAPDKTPIALLEESNKD